MNTIAIPKKIDKELTGFSRELGVSKEDLFINAILYYLQVLQKRADLSKELEIWDKASIEDFIKFERRIHEKR